MKFDLVITALILAVVSITIAKASVSNPFRVIAEAMKTSMVLPAKAA